MEMNHLNKSTKLDLEICKCTNLPPPHPLSLIVYSPVK